jgi:flagellar biogenesis protein FliO
LGKVVKTTPKSLPKWLLVPPVAALLLLLGPLSMQGAERPAQANEPPASQQPANQPTTTSPAVTGEANPARTALRTPTPVRTPDLFEMSGALVVVLLLGAAGVYVLRKLRGGAVPTGGTTLLTLRQSLRLSQKQIVHAIEFDDRIVLVGEGERGLALLDSGRIPERVADELEVAARALPRVDAVVADDLDDGAVPKNLVIPRPAQPPRPRPVKAPQSPAPTPARPAVGLGDFRNLLQKAGR